MTVGGLDRANLGPLQATGIPSPTQNPQNAPRISIGITHQKPASTLGLPSQPKSGPITGNPNQMERGKISGEPESGPCCLCQFYRRPCIKHECFQINGDFSGNWNHLTTFEPIYEDEVVMDTADRD